MNVKTPYKFLIVFGGYVFFLGILFFATLGVIAFKNQGFSALAKGQYTFTTVVQPNGDGIPDEDKQEYIYQCINAVRKHQRGSQIVEFKGSNLNFYKSSVWDTVYLTFEYSKQFKNSDTVQMSDAQCRFNKDKKLQSVITGGNIHHVGGYWN